MANEDNRFIWQPDEMQEVKTEPEPPKAKVDPVKALLGEKKQGKKHDSK